MKTNLENNNLLDNLDKHYGTCGLGMGVQTNL